MGARRGRPDLRYLVKKNRLRFAWWIFSRGVSKLRFYFRKLPLATTVKRVSQSGLSIKARVPVRSSKCDVSE